MKFIIYISIFLQNWKQLSNLLIKSCSLRFIKNEYKLRSIKMIFDTKFYANYFMNQLNKKKKLTKMRFKKKIISLLSSKI